MNTKNIFRMLLLAATLLLGANNAKATEKNIWSGSASLIVEIDKSTFSDLEFTPNIIKIYADHVNSRFWAKDINEILWRESQHNEYVYANNSDYDKAHYKTDHYEFEITSEIFTKLQANGLKVVQDYGNGITSIVVSDEGSSSTTEKQNSSISFSGNVEMTFGSTFTAPTVTKTPSDAAITYSSSDSKIALIDGNGNVVPVGAGTATITGTYAGNDAYNGTTATYTLKVNAPTTSGANWQGAVWLDWNNNASTNITTNDAFKAIKAGDQILIYGKRGPLHATNFNLELFQLNSDWSWGTMFVELNQDDFSSTDGCFTITVSNDNVEAIQNGLKDNVQGHCAAANGWNFTITAIKVIAGTSDTEHGTFVNNTWTFDFASMAGTVETGTKLTLTEEKTINEVKMHKASWEGNYINTKLLLGQGSDENTWQLLPTKHGGTLYLNNSNKKIGFKNLTSGQKIKLNIVVEESGNEKTKKYPLDSDNYNVTLTTDPGEDGVFVFTVSNDGDAYINLGNKTYIKSIVIDPAPEPVSTYSVNYTANLTGGNVSVYAGTNNIASGTKVEAGVSITINLNPAPNYKISSVTASYSGGEIVLSTNDNINYIFTMPAGDVSIYASFNRVAATPQVIIGETKYATWTPDYAIDYSQANGIEAYRAESCTDGVVVLKQITGQAKAKTPVLLKATSAGTYTFTEDINGGYNVGTNLLEAGTGGTIGPNANYYILTLKNGVVVFAQANKGANVPEGKAFLNLSKASGARTHTIRLSFGDSGNGTTGINGIEENAEMDNTIIYDLRGQRVDKPTKGLYIINGKKVMIK